MTKSPAAIVYNDSDCSQEEETAAERKGMLFMRKHTLAAQNNDTKFRSICRVFFYCRSIQMSLKLREEKKKKRHRHTVTSETTVTPRIPDPQAGVKLDL